MVAVEFEEAWKRMRSELQGQIKALETTSFITNIREVDEERRAMIAGLKRCAVELDKILEGHARANRT